MQTCHSEATSEQEFLLRLVDRLPQKVSFLCPVLWMNICSQRTEAKSYTSAINKLTAIP